MIKIYTTERRKTFKFGLATAIWFGAGLAIVANGFIGEFCIKDIIGDYGNHVYKTLIGLVVAFCMGLIYAKQVKGEGWQKSCWTAGIYWFILTLIFEFVAGHYLFGNSWEALFNDYRFWKGRLWTLFLLAAVFSPYLVGKYLNK